MRTGGRAPSAWLGGWGACPVPTITRPTVSRCRCGGPTWTPTATSTTCSTSGCSRTPGSSASASGSPTGRRCSTRASSSPGTPSSTAPRSPTGRPRSRSTCGSPGCTAPASTWATPCATLPTVGDQVYAIAETGLALYDFATARPRRLAPEARAQLAAHVGDAGALPLGGPVTAVLRLHRPRVPRRPRPLRLAGPHRRRRRARCACRRRARCSPPGSACCSGTGILAEGTVLGLRTFALAEPAEARRHRAARGGHRPQRA